MSVIGHCRDNQNKIFVVYLRNTFETQCRVVPLNCYEVIQKNLEFICTFWSKSFYNVLVLMLFCIDNICFSAPDVTNLFSHKLAYSDFFKMADASRKFYDILSN